MAFASSTGLQPFNAARSCTIMAVIVATLTFTELSNAFIFCGFNGNFIVDVPLGVSLTAACILSSLLGLAVNRKPTTKCGRILKMFAGISVGAILAVVTCASILQATTLQILAHHGPDLDPFNICGNRTNEVVKTEFSNLAPIYGLLQRIDLIFKSLIAVAWATPLVWFCVITVAFLRNWQDRLRMEALDGNNQSGKKRTYFEHFLLNGFDCLRKKTSEVSDQPAAVDIDDESAPADAIPEISEQQAKGSQEMKMEDGTTPSDDGGYDAKSQFHKALPELSIVDEEEETTATKEGGK